MALNVYERRRIAVLAVLTTIVALVVAAVGGSGGGTEAPDTVAPTTIAVTTTSTPLENAQAVGPLADDSSKPINLDGPLAQIGRAHV